MQDIGWSGCMRRRINLWLDPFMLFYGSYLLEIVATNKSGGGGWLIGNLFGEGLDLEAAAMKIRFLVNRWFLCK